MVSWSSPIIIIPVAVVGSCVLCMIVSGFISYIFMLRYRLKQARTESARLAQMTNGGGTAAGTQGSTQPNSNVAPGTGMPQIIGGQRPRYVGVAVGYNGEENVIMMVSDSAEADLLRQGYPLVFSSAMTMEPLPSRLAAAIANAQSQQQAANRAANASPAGSPPNAIAVSNANNTSQHASSLSTAVEMNDDMGGGKVNLFTMSTSSEVPIFVTRARAIYGYGPNGSSSCENLMGFEALSGASLGSPSFLILSDGGAGGVFFEAEASQKDDKQPRRWIRRSFADLNMRSGSSVADDEVAQRQKSDTHTTRIPIPESPICASNTTAAGSNATSHSNAPFTGSEEDMNGVALSAAAVASVHAGFESPLLPRTVPTNYGMTSAAQSPPNGGANGRKKGGGGGGNEALQTLLWLEQPHHNHQQRQRAGSGNAAYPVGKAKGFPRQCTIPRIPVYALDRNEELRAKLGLTALPRSEQNMLPATGATTTIIMIPGENAFATSPNPEMMSPSLTEPLIPSPHHQAANGNNGPSFDYTTTISPINQAPISPPINPLEAATDSRTEATSSPVPRHIYFSAAQGERSESTDVMPTDEPRTEARFVRQAETQFSINNNDRAAPSSSDDLAPSTPPPQSGALRQA